jgi:hypothetical protein
MRRLASVVTLLLLSPLAALAASRPEAKPGNVPGNVPQQLDRIEQKVDAVTSALSSLQATIDALQGTVNVLQSTLDAQTAILNGFSASGVPTKPRRYYLTGNVNADGSQATSACAAGFHMANLFEFLDPTGLRYDATVGLTRADSGQGPPTAIFAWARTGYVSAAGNDFAGKVNCQAWTSNADSDFGTVVELRPDWRVFYAFEDPFLEDVGREAPWLGAARVSCDHAFPVWCVEDR